MNRFWDANRRFIQVAGGGLLLFIILQIAVVDSLATERENIDKTREKRLTKIKDNRKGTEAINHRIEFLQQETDRLKQNRKELMEALEVKFPEWDPTKIPVGVSPINHFWSKRAQVKIKHEQLFLNDGVMIEDEHFGFDPDSIAALTKKEALENLKKLAMVDKLLTLLRRAKVSRIITVKPEKIQKTGALRSEARRFNYGGKLVDKYTSFIREIPVEIQVVGPVDSLMRFLHSVRRKNDFLMIRNIVIHNRHAGGLESRGVYEKMQNSELLVTITAAGMSFLSEKEIRKEIEDSGGPDATAGPAHKPVPTHKGPVGPYKHNTIQGAP